MLFRVLGPLEVELGDGSTAMPGGARARALLATLLMQPDTLVTVSRLAEAIWGDDPPANVDNAVHVVVGRLRRSLGPAGARLVTGAGGGYRLDLTGARLDAVEFEDACRAARAASSIDPAGAVRDFDRALAWWRGAAFGEFADTFARPAAVRLDELRRAAAEERTDALLRCGDVDGAVAAAADLVAAYPLAERPVEVAMAALVAAGRTSDALDAYRQHAEVLREEMGLDPPAPLRELQSRILRSGLGRRRRSDVAAGPARLPHAGSPLFGREAELSALQAALQRPGLITLVGPGGVGKTRTAVELVGRCARDGRRVWWVDLVPVPPSRVADAVAAATGVEIPPEADPEDTLCAALAASDGILVLDNAEHVLDTTAALAERLCETAGGLAVLATSRERLAVDGERVRRLAPLPLPPGPDRDNPAVALFLDRAPGSAVGDHDVALVARLCRHLDGLPLAIELGAARAGGLGLEVLIDRLAERLDLLSGGRRTAGRRHSTLRAVIEWSYDLLAPGDAALFARLGVFPGAFTLGQVEAICGDPADGGTVPPAVPVLLARLVEGSLVQLDPPGRFVLLESLRTFARDRLVAVDESARMRRRHAHDTADRLREISPQLWTEEEGAAVRELTALTADLHTAWEYALRTDPDLALRLAGDVYDYAYFHQRLDLLRWGLTIAAWPCDDPARAAAFGTAAAATWSAARVGDAALITERGIELAGGPDATAAALPMEISANIAMFRGRTDDAVARYRRAAALRHAREPVRALVTELACAHALVNGRRAEEAADIVAQARPRAVRAGNPTALAWTYYLAGEVDAETNPERAARAYRTAIDWADRADSRLFGTMAESSAAALASRRGHVVEALAAFGVVLDHWVQLGNTGTLGWSLHQVAILLAQAGADDDAATLAGAVLAAAGEIPSFAVDTDRVHAALDGVRARLGETATADAVDTGAAMAISAAVVMAREALTRALDLAQDG